MEREERERREYEVRLARLPSPDRHKLEARKRKFLLEGTSEVSIEDIYAQLFSASQRDEIAPAVRRERAEATLPGSRRPAMVRAAS